MKKQVNMFVSFLKYIAVAFTEHKSCGEMEIRWGRFVPDGT